MRDFIRVRSYIRKDGRRVRSHRRQRSQSSLQRTIDYYEQQAQHYKNMALISGKETRSRERMLQLSKEAKSKADYARKRLKS